VFVKNFASGFGKGEANGGDSSQARIFGRGFYHTADFIAFWGELLAKVRSMKWMLARLLKPSAISSNSWSKHAVIGK
jgi:hypothetical protein